MRDFLARQVAILNQSIDGYRKGLFSLNSLIQRIDGVIDVIGCDVWKDEVFPLMLALEEINAVALDAGKDSFFGENPAVEGLLCELEKLILRLDLFGGDVEV